MRKALRLPAVLEATGLARPTVYKKMALNPPEFPRGNKLPGIRARVWWEDEIVLWQKGQWRPEREGAADA
ncbi:MAG: AlpA family phage regulatory protein [Methylocystis sp.]